MSELQSSLGPVRDTIPPWFPLSRRALDCPTVCLVRVTGTHCTAKHHGSIWLMGWRVNFLDGSSGIIVSCLFKLVTCFAWAATPSYFWCRC